MARLPLALLVALALVACEDAVNDPLAIDATGEVVGAVFLDLNVSNRPDAGDQLAPGIRMLLVRANTNDTVASSITDASGVFRFEDVAVGTYAVVPAASSLGDSLRVVFRDPPGLPVAEIGDEPTTVTVGAVDTVDVAIGLAFPAPDIAAARALPPGRTVTIQGVALTEIGQVGDSSLFLQGEGAAIRITRTVTTAPIGVGDLLLVQGTTARRSGQPVLNNGRVTVLTTGETIDTTAVSAGVARTAAGGGLDADLVFLRELAITDTATAAGFFVATAVDPSGSIELAFRVGGFTGLVLGPGMVVDVTGVLVPHPSAGAVWQVRPRSEADVDVR